MVSFQRMKDDFDEISNQVEAKLPRKSFICVAILVCAVLVFLLGIVAGVGSAGAVDCGWCGGNVSCNVGSIPVYHWLGRTNESCPALTGELLLTTLSEVQSFEGLSVELQCEAGYSPFPLSVQCERRKHYDGSSWLQWSNYPVCYPSMKDELDHMSSIQYARSVYCTGSPGYTQCKLHCVNSYVAVEDTSYSCSSLPCPAWTPQGRRCYVCSESCQ